MASENPRYQYWAFISYANRDRRWARWLLRSIETYGIPAQLMTHVTPAGEPAPRRFQPLFHDRSELSAAADLGPAIERALRASRYLIVICSPQAAKSVWVNREIETFQGFHRADHIFAIIVEGEPNSATAECFPPLLRHPAEPLAADARGHADGKLNAKLKLLAGMLGVKFDALKQRDAQRRIRRLQVTLAAVVALVMGFAGLAWYATVQRDSAVRNESRANANALEADRQKNAATQAKGEAEQERDRAESQAYFASIEGARILIDRGDFINARRLLDEAPAVERNWEWGYLRGSLDRSAETFRVAQPDVSGTAVGAGSHPLMFFAHDFLTDRWRFWDGLSGGLMAVLQGGQPHPSGIGEDIAYAPVFVVCSPDGSRIITVAVDRKAHVWDRASGKELFQLSHRDLVASAVFSADGKSILTTSKDQTAAVWDGETGKQRAAFLTHSNWVTCGAFSADGTLVVTGSKDGTARVWDAATGGQVAVLDKSGGWVRAVAFSSDGSRVVTGGDDHVARVWDARTGFLLAKLEGHEEQVDCVAFSADGLRIVTGSQDKSVRVWDARSGSQLAVLRGHEGTVTGAVFGEDGATILTGSQDKTGRLWEVGAGGGPGALRGHAYPVNSAAFSPDGRRVVTGSGDQTGRIWDLWSGDTVAVLGGHGGPAEGVYSADGSRIVTFSTEFSTGSWDANVWDAASGRKIAGFAKKETAFGFAVNGEATQLVPTSSRSQAVDVRSGNALAAVGDVRCAAFVPGSARLLTASEDGKIHVWDSATWREVMTLDNQAAADRIRISGNGRWFVTTAGSDTLRVWETDTGRQVSVLTWPKQIDGAAINGDGTVAVVRWDTVEVWPLHGREPAAVLRGHDQWILHIEFSPDAKRIVTASDDGTARVWDTRSGKEVAILRGQQGGIGFAAFSPDGTRIVTALHAGEVQVWDSVSVAERYAVRWPHFVPSFEAGAGR